MQVMLDIPETIANEAGGTPEAVARHVLERYALDGYNARRFGHFAVQTLLGFSSWMETEEFLRKNKAPLQYDIKDFEQDMFTLRKVFGE